MGALARQSLVSLSLRQATHIMLTWSQRGVLALRAAHSESSPAPLQPRQLLCAQIGSLTAHCDDPSQPRS
jgi:hypothetical protein